MDKDSAPRGPYRILGQLLLSGTLGLAAAAAVIPAAFSILRGVDGCCFCSYFLAFPVVGALIGWHVPRGCPGASIAVAIFLALTLPPGIGATSKTMNPVFAVMKGLGLLIGEVSGATFKQVRESKAGREAR